MKGFDFEEDKIKQEITKLGAKRVLLQLPEGLKPEGPRLAKLVEKLGALPIISADPCYGACDLAVDEAESLGVDLIVHFGHTKFLKCEGTPTVYVETKAQAPIDEALNAAVLLLRGYAKIGLATTVQHLESLGKAREILASAGKTVVVGDKGEVAYAGQVVGCNYSNVTSIAAQVDAFVFVGGGVFHALGVALSTSKPTFIADPYDNRAYSVDEEAQKIFKKRWACIQQAESAASWGILVGLKPGQKKLSRALSVKALAKKHGKEAFLFASREVTPEILLEFPSIDAYVNTACPRISLDASGKFSKPVLTVNEFMVASGESSWENMLKKGLFES